MPIERTGPLTVDSITNAVTVDTVTNPVTVDTITNPVTVDTITNPVTVDTITNPVTIVNNSFTPVTSTNNTTTTPLSSGATFTGTADSNALPDVMVSCQTDNTGTLFFDFSIDGTNWTTFPVNGFDVSSGIHEFHTAVKGPRQFRVRLVNDTGAQSYLRLTTYFGTFRQSNAPLNQSIGDDADAIITRSVLVGADQNGTYSNVGVTTNGLLEVGDFYTEVSKEVVGNHTSFRKFGASSAVAASETYIAQVGGTAPYLPTSATTIEAISTDSDDTAAGSGAQQILVFGLDGSFNLISETLTMNGTSATTASSASFLFVYRAYVTRTGTYLGTNEGTITIRASSGGTSFATIGTGLGQTELSGYLVPAGYTLYVNNVNFLINSSKAVNLRFWRCDNVNDATTPFTGAKRVVKDFQGATGIGSIDMRPSLVFPEYTMVWWSGTASGGGGGAQVAYNGVLVAA